MIYNNTSQLFENCKRLGWNFKIKSTGIYRMHSNGNLEQVGNCNSNEQAVDVLKGAGFQLDQETTTWC